MRHRTFTTIAGVVFGIIAALHALRLLSGWEATIGDWRVPFWVSWMAIGVFGWLTYAAWTIKKKYR